MAAILGIHHVTAIASDPQRNLDFYAGLLGLRLVKRTVNFDDPETYHLYYGDEVGTPGSILTFFPWPGARRGRAGVGQPVVTAFAVLPHALAFWVERLVQHGVVFRGPAARGSGHAGAEQVLAFEDPDGLAIELVASAGAESKPAWGHAPGIPVAHALHGFHAVTLSVAAWEPTERVLVDTLGFRPLAERGTTQGGTTRRYAVGDGAPGTLVDVCAVAGPGGAVGAGTVHHIAFAVSDDAAELAVRERVTGAGLHPTPVIDRQYFHSVYFREPGGVLFEVATTPPGFAVDEPVERLGERLMLPPPYEARRAEIEAALPRIHLPMPPSSTPAFADVAGAEDVSEDALGFVHRYVPPAGGHDLAGSTTLLLLHGTGGDEGDLLPLGRALLPGAGLLSPRGPVLERGAARFFRRHADGVFDQEDLARRTDDLAHFVEGAAGTYQFDREAIVAVGLSNGANIAASLLLRHPTVLRAAVLLRPMVAFEPEAPPNLTGTAVFLGAGRADPIAPATQAERLAAILREAGADVTLHWTPGGHAVTKGEVDAAHAWLARRLIARTGIGPGAAVR